MTIPKTLVYFGTPQIAVPPLNALVEAGFDVCRVITGHDKRRRRNGKPEPTPVKACADTHGIEVSHSLDGLEGLDADLGVIVAYGSIIPESALSELDMVNIHFSELPRWRGAAPLERAILAGDQTTAVTIMAVANELDTGDVYASEHLEIGDLTRDELATELADRGANLLVKTLKAGLGIPVPQVGEPTYAHKIEKSDRVIDWNQSAEQLLRQCRIGGALCEFRGQQLAIQQAHRATSNHVGVPGELVGSDVICVDQTISIDVVRPPSRGDKDARDWFRSQNVAPGEKLT